MIYTCKASLYAGKKEKGTGPYYIDLTENHFRYLVNQTENDLVLQGRKISYIQLSR